MYPGSAGTFDAVSSTCAGGTTKGQKSRCSRIGSNRPSASARSMMACGAGRRLLTRRSSFSHAPLWHENCQLPAHLHNQIERPRQRGIETLPAQAELAGRRAWRAGRTGLPEAELAREHRLLPLACAPLLRHHRPAKQRKRRRCLHALVVAVRRGRRQLQRGEEMHPATTANRASARAYVSNSCVFALWHVGGITAGPRKCRGRGTAARAAAGPPCARHAQSASPPAARAARVRGPRTSRRGGIRRGASAQR